MIVDNIVDIGYINTSAAQIGTDKRIDGVVGKKIKMFLALFLLQGTMIGDSRETLFQKIVCHPLHSIAVVQEHHAALLPYLAKQLS